MRMFAKEIDVYAGIAIIFVVLIHSNSFYLNEILQLKKYSDSGYLLTMVDQIIHIAVPMFIFTAGFKFEISSKEYSYKIYAKKRLSKVFVPFLFISGVFILFNLISEFITSSASISSLLRTAIVNTGKIFIGYNAAYQLWYIPMYLFVVLSYPIVIRYIKKSTTRYLVFSAASTIYIMLSSFTDLFTGHPYPFSFVYYFIFFELGRHVCKNKFSRSKQTKLFVIGLMIFVLSILTASGRFDSLVTDLIFTPIAVIIFYFVSLYLKENRTFAWLGRYSFYIFLLHEPLFVSGISKIIQNLGWYTGYHVTILVVVFAIIISIGLYKILSILGLSKLIFTENKQPKKTNIAAVQA